MRTHLLPVADTLEEARDIAKKRLEKRSLKIVGWDIRKDYDGYYVVPVEDDHDYKGSGYDSCGAFVERVML